MTETINVQPAQRPGLSKRRRFSRAAIPWLFILPVLVFHAVIVFVPTLYGVYYSLTDWTGLGTPEFVGLDNFVRLFTEDDDFFQALKNNAKWMLFFLTVPFVLALAAAYLMSQIIRGGFFFRMVLFLPFVLPSVVVAAIWRNLMNPNTGLGAVLADLGIPGLDVAFLGQTSTSLWAIAFIDNWHYWGFLTILFLTAMQNVSPDLYDAATIDGANRWQQFRHVTLPGIRPTVLFMLMMSAIWSFLVFDYVWILTEGGPAGSSEVMGTLVYKNAFRHFEVGYAAAQGITMSGFAALIVLIFIVLRRRGWEV